jgi:tetratricopeptide (TPR) repeat protein
MFYLVKRFFSLIKTGIRDASRMPRRPQFSAFVSPAICYVGWALRGMAMSSDRPRLISLLLLSIVAAPACLLANGGGGGGGGGMPSSSAPQYDPAAEYQKGLAALTASRYAEARRAFDHVQQVVPTDANSAYLAGVASDGLEKPKDARRYYERAMRIDHGRIDVHRGLALALVKLGEKDKAQAELDFLKAEAAKCAATTCGAADSIEAAVKDVTAALSGQQTSFNVPLPKGGSAGDIVYAEAVSLINRHNYADALESLDRAGRSFGPHPDILTYIGYTNRKIGRLDTAEIYYRRALAIAPRHRGALEYYGELKVERGDLSGARANLARLENICRFGCYESEELKRWIVAEHDPAA